MCDMEGKMETVICEVVRDKVDRKEYGGGGGLLFSGKFPRPDRLIKVLHGERQLVHFSFLR